MLFSVVIDASASLRLILFFDFLFLDSSLYQITIPKRTANTTIAIDTPITIAILLS